MVYATWMPRHAYNNLKVTRGTCHWFSMSVTTHLDLPRGNHVINDVALRHHHLDLLLYDTWRVKIHGTLR